CSICDIIYNVLKRCSLPNHLLIKNKELDMKIKDITRLAIVATIYVVFTLIIHPLSFDYIQFRFSEILVLLCFYRKDYVYSLVVGCLIANMFSPFAVYDMIFGTMATLISVILISKSKNLLVATLYPVLFNGIRVGSMLYFVLDLPVSMFASIGYVALGEFVVVSIVGFILFKILEKNRMFIEVIKANQNIETNAN